MNRIEWTTAAIKGYAALQIFGAILTTVGYSVNILSLPTIAGLNGQSEVPIQIYLIYISIIVITFVLSIVLWRKAYVLAHWIWRPFQSNAETVEAEEPQKSFKLMANIVTIIGIYILISRLPSWIGAFQPIIFYGRLAAQGTLLDNSFNAATAGEYLNIFANLLQMLLAIAFIAVPQRIVAFLDKISDTWDLITEI